jgi:protein SCO1/2
LVTQDGKTVHFYDDVIKNKVVAISFIFTKCRGPCPAETASLRKVEQLLGERMGRDVFMYSISIDPEHDRPGTGHRSVLTAWNIVASGIPNE